MDVPWTGQWRLPCPCAVPLWPAFPWPPLACAVGFPCFFGVPCVPVACFPCPCFPCAWTGCLTGPWVRAPCLALAAACGRGAADRPPPAAGGAGARRAPGGG